MLLPYFNPRLFNVKIIGLNFTPDPGMKWIFAQFFDGVGGAFDDFAGGDLVGDFGKGLAEAIGHDFQNFE